jgi:hypothetical protein
MAMFAAAEKFLAKHLGGRYQESMTPEVAQRLKEIMVDVKTVQLAKKIEAALSRLAQAHRRSDARQDNYKGTLEISGQTLPLTISNEVAEEANGAWVVTESAQTPMGPMSDKSRSKRAA